MLCNLKYKSIPLVLVYFVILTGTRFLYAEIKKTISPDGTVEYYNSTEIQQTGKKHEFKSRYNDLIENISQSEGVDPYLVKCIIKVESNFSADAVSVAGAMGLMQIMQDIARYYNVKDPFDPEENLTAGIRHFKSLMSYFKDDVQLSVAAYHAGIGRVKKNMQVPPIQSTVDYVNNVMYFYNGTKSNGSNLEKVRKLYRRINNEGTIEIYNK